MLSGDRSDYQSEPKEQEDYQESIDSSNTLDSMWNASQWFPRWYGPGDEIPFGKFRGHKAEERISTEDGVKESPDLNESSQVHDSYDFMEPTPEQLENNRW